uniref:Uncharacterized protein n=1 Tax=Timema poppense TaxID=170557 RepID=A0A7R9GSH1_TIMPO|nr:unnamed protein product [Timema poppensis]
MHLGDHTFFLLGSFEKEMSLGTPLQGTHLFTFLPDEEPCRFWGKQQISGFIRRDKLRKDSSLMMKHQLLMNQLIQTILKFYLEDLLSINF